MHPECFWDAAFALFTVRIRCADTTFYVTGYNNHIHIITICIGVTSHNNHIHIILRLRCPCAAAIGV